MKITKEIRRIALFMAFGDGCIEKYGNLTIKHCIAQKEYLLYKYKLIKVLCNHAPIEITNNNFKAFKLNTKCFDFLKLYRRILYPNNKKTLTRKLLNKLTPLGIYLWYLDDGGMSKRQVKNGYAIKEIMLNTGLNKEENQIIIDYFKDVWNISFSQVKNHNCYRLRCGKKEGEKFLKIFNKYHNDVISMKYKIDPNFHISTDVGEMNPEME